MMNHTELVDTGPPNKKAKIGSQASLIMGGGGTATITNGTLNTQISETSGKKLIIYINVCF